MAGVLIQGTARSRAGQAIAEARVYFTRAPVALPDIAALTGEDGRFTLNAPAAGTYTIEVNADGFHPASTTFDVDDGLEIALTLELVPA